MVVVGTFRESDLFFLLFLFCLGICLPSIVGSRCAAGVVAAVVLVGGLSGVAQASPADVLPVPSAPKVEFVDQPAWFAPSEVSRAVIGSEPFGMKSKASLGSTSRSRQAAPGAGAADAQLGSLPFYPYQSFRLAANLQVAVNAGTGNVFVADDVLTLKSAGVPVVFGAFYNSLDAGAGSLGSRWRATLGDDQSLTIDGTNAAYRDASGIVQTFVKNPDGSWTAPVTLKASLKTEADGSYTLVFNQSGERLSFSSGGFLVKDLDRNGVGLSYAYTDGKVSSIIDSAGRVTTITTAADRTTATLADGRTVVYQKDASGKLTSVSIPGADQANPQQETTIGYDSNNRLSVLRVKGGNVSRSSANTRFEYDGSNRLVSIRQEDTANPTSPVLKSRVTSFAYQSGQTVVTAPDGKTSTIKLDSNGRQISATDQLGRTRSTTWTSNSDVQSATSGSQSGGPAGDVTEYQYDSLGNRTGVSLPTGAASAAIYQQGSNCTSGTTGDPYQVKCGIDAQGNKTSYSYDPAGNRTGTRNETSNQTTSTFTREKTDRSVCGGFAGMACTSTDANGNQTSYTYNVNGDLTKVTAPAGVTSYTYDSMSRAITVTDPAGVKTTYTYTRDDQLASQQNTSNTGQMIRYVTNPTEFDGVKASTDASWLSAFRSSYSTQDGFFADPLGRSFGTSAPAGDPQRQFEQAFSDGKGNLAKLYDRFRTGSFQTNDPTYSYDAANQQTTVKVAGAADTDCTNTTTAAAANSNCITYTYDNNGNLATQSFPGGAKKTISYDASARPTRISVKDSTGATVLDLGYTYKDAAGTDRGLLQNKTSYVEEGLPDGAVTSYTYDGRNRLTKAEEKTGTTVNASWAYAYDGNGNRTSITTIGNTGSSGGTITTSYDGANRITGTSASPTGWTYDANSNLTNSPNLGLQTSYDSRNNVTGFTKDNTTSAVKSFGQGNDDRRSVGNTTEIRNSQGLAATITNGIRTNYTYDAKTGAPIAFNTGGATTYLIGDKQNSTMVLLDGTGRKIGGYSYSPYGEARTVTPGAAQTNIIRYAGAQYETQTGLYKMGYRYYDPSQGRFTQQDPSGQETNPYNYVSCNPINATDPAGLDSFGDCLRGSVQKSALIGMGVGFLQGVVGGGIAGSAAGGVGAIPGAAAGGIAGAIGGTLTGAWSGLWQGSITCGLGEL
ncbi:MAG: DUF6531 domain-containing protein [Renibacterium salmoninarum]|nr:DUF6531 domain-containing protein [Renibacterium salmoninarum]